MKKAIMFTLFAFIASLQHVDSGYIRNVYRHPEETLINRPAHYRGHWPVSETLNGAKYDTLQHSFDNGQDKLYPEERYSERETPFPRKIKDDTIINRHGRNFRSSQNEDEEENNRKIESNIQSRIEALKDAVRKELNSGRETPFPRNIKDDTIINRHGRNFRSSQNEDEEENNRKIESNIQSRIEALKETVRKELARGEMTRRNENGQHKRKAEEPLSYKNDAYYSKQGPRSFQLGQDELYSEERDRDREKQFPRKDETENNRKIESHIQSLIEVLREAIRKELYSEERDSEGETHFPRKIKDDTIINRHGRSFRSSQNEDKEENNRKIESNIHSRIEALKETVRREL
ncbi:myb-like protein X [Zootermopsis nevadensis]|uniref:Uncharacterized protein n=1 Tax=Zootermopsis nevadensis TaxID=136037 RepID=A0A067RPG6_ZOONE|nr:myb-like protein X [Zootermopsis nevadensis]KDR22525.1 hypothetical protein L798_02239 [Zootermopsis nevadensis]